MRFDPFFPAQVVASSPHQTLLCERITIPTVPSCDASCGALAKIWKRGEQAIHEGCSWEACHIFLLALTNEDLPPRRILQFLFEAAFRLLSAGDQTAADRCLQKALGVLACQSDRAVTDSLTDQWLVLATSGLLKNDLDSCELWLRQARRSLTRMESNGQTSKARRYRGDCFAIEAQLAAALGHSVRAIELLSQAYDNHLKAEASCSAAQDLILRSRCCVGDLGLESAEADLVQAESLVRVVFSPRDENDCRRLLTVVLEDRAKLNSRRRAFGVARWN